MPTKYVVPCPYLSNDTCNPMRRSMSKAGKALYAQIARPSLGPQSCTCARRFFRASMGTASDEGLNEGFTAAENTPTETSRNPITSQHMAYHPRSQKARLAEVEKRTTVLVNRLGKTVTPFDIRRFARQKLGLGTAENSVRDGVLMLPI